MLVDLGCGIGTFIRTFGGRFDQIVGLEYAPRIMARAKRRCAAMKGVEWLTMDLARGAETIGCRADLTVCLNVITSASAAVRNAQWAAVASVTRPSGFALVVVPSLESDAMLMEAHRAEKSGKAAATAEGLADRDGSRQKHYRRDELIEIFDGLGLEVKRLGPVFSPWSGEGLDKPRAGRCEGSVGLDLPGAEAGEATREGVAPRRRRPDAAKRNPRACRSRYSLSMMTRTGLSCAVAALTIAHTQTMKQIGPPMMTPMPVNMKRTPIP